MADDIYDIYTLPDGKEVRFEQGTAADVVDRHLLKKYPESMAYTPEDTSLPGDGFSENPSAFDRFFTALGGGLEHGATKVAPGIGAAVANVTGNEEAWSAAQREFASQTEKLHNNNPNVPSFKEVKAKYNQLGLWSALGEMVDLTAHASGSSLGESAIPVSLMAAGALTGGAALGVAGAGVMFTQFVADNIERGMADGTATTEDVDLHKVLTAAAAQTALERVSLGVAKVVPFGSVSKALGNAVKAGSPAVANAANKASVEIVQKSLAKQLGAGANAFLAATAAETGTELGQELFERYAAGETFIPDFDDQEQFDEFIEVAVQSALGSAPFSSYAGAHGFTQSNAAFRKQEGFKKQAEETAKLISDSDEAVRARKARDELKTQKITNKISKDSVEEAEGLVKDLEKQAEIEGKRRVAGIKAVDRTVPDIENVAKARGLDIDSNPRAQAGFQRMVFQTTGNHNWRKASASDLDLVYEKIAGMSPQDESTSLPETSTAEVVSIAEEIENEQSKNLAQSSGLYNTNLTKVQLKRKIMDILKRENGLLHAGKNHASVRADAIMKQMQELEIALKNPKVKGQKGSARFRVDVSSLLALKDKDIASIASQASQAAASSVRLAEDSKGNVLEIVGEYPNQAALSEIVGPIEKSTYDTIRDALLRRGVLRKRKGKYFYADVPEVLANRREIDRSERPVSKWIVRDHAGQVVYQANTRAEAQGLRANNESQAKLRAPQREKGYVVRETDWSNFEGENPVRVRGQAVAFVPDEAGASALADQRVAELRSQHESIRSEYLGSQGQEINTDVNPELIREARKGDQDRALELAIRDPFNADAVIDRYHMGLEAGDPARQNIDRFDFGRTWQIPFDMAGKKGPNVPVVVKNGAYDESTGRGFGKARMDIHSPGWLNRITDLMEAIRNFDATQPMDGAQAFGNTGRFTIVSEGAGRTVIVDGHGDSAQYFVFDYVTENGEPAFHLYNQFDGTASYQDSIEDMGPMQGHALYRGNPKPESVRVAENPNHESVRRQSPAEKAEMVIGSPTDKIAGQAGANRVGPAKPPSRSLFAHVGRMIERFWGEDTMMRLRTLFIDQYDPIVVREGKIVDKFGQPLTSEISAVAAARQYARMADMTWESLTNGYIEAVGIANADGVHEGAQVMVAKEHTLTNQSPMMTVYDPHSQTFEQKEYSAELFNESRGNLNGGILTVLQALTPTELDMMHKYRSALRSRNLRKDIETRKPGEKALVPLTPDQEKEYLQYLDDPDSGAKIAVAVANLNDLNQKTVEYLVKTGILSEKDAGLWLQHSDYISFYRDFESPGKQGYKKKHEQERIQHGIPDSLLGDLTYQAKHRSYEGFEVEEDFENEVIDQTEAMLSNLVAAYTAGSVNVARTRAIRNEITLDSARRVDGPDGGLADETPVKILVDGEPQYFVLDDEVMFATLEGDWDNKLGSFIRNHKYLHWITSTPTQWLRETVTRDPSFSLPNLVRDAFAASMVNNDPKLFISSINRMGHNFAADIRGEKVHESARTLALHGVVSGHDQVAGHHGAKDITQALKNKLAGKNDTHLKRAWDGLGRFSFMSESATREIVYEHTLAIERDRLRNLGKYSDRDIEIVAQNEAMFQAKEILNFSTRGKSQALAAFTSAVPFINAMIQGNDVLARGLFKFRRAGFDNTISVEQRSKNMIRRAMYVMGAAAMLEMLNVGDDEYESQGQYKRDTNFFLPVPGTVSTYVTIPAPHGISFFVKGLPQLAVRNAYHSFVGEHGRVERETLDQIKGFMTSGFDGGSIMPTVLKAPYQWAANKTLWGGMPIDKFWQEALPAEDRYTSSTTAQARAIGQMGVSPQQIDATIDAMFGGLGAAAWGALDAILRSPAGFIDEWPLPVQPRIEVKDMVILKRMLVTQPGNQHSSDYYDLRRAISEVAGRLRNAHTPAEKARIKREYLPLTIAGKQLASTNKRMLALRNEEERVRSNPGNKYTFTEVRDRLEAIKRKRISVLKNAERVRRQLDKGR